MSWLLVLIVVPLLVVGVATKVFVLRELWRTRRDRPGLRDLPRGGKIAMVASAAIVVGVVTLLQLNQEQAAGFVLAGLLGIFALVVIGLVPLAIWIDLRGSDDLRLRFLGRHPRNPHDS